MKCIPLLLAAVTLLLPAFSVETQSGPAPDVPGSTRDGLYYDSENGHNWRF